MDDMKHVARVKRRRDESGKETEIHVRKRRVKDSKIERFMERNPGAESRGGSF